MNVIWLLGLYCLYNILASERFKYAIRRKILEGKKNTIPFGI